MSELPMKNENQHVFQARAMGQPLPESTPELITWARRWTHHMGVPLDLLRELARRLEDTQKQPPLQFMLTREGKIGVGYSNKTEEGGFTVLKWLPDDMVKDAADRDGVIRIHPAHWSAIYEYENAALVWDNLVGQKGDKDEETQRYLAKMRQAISRLRIAKALLEIPQSLLGVDREELLRRCGLRHLKSASKGEGE